MRIIFIGSVVFSKFLLSHMIKKRYNIVGVQTKKNSNFNSDHFDLKKICREKKILCRYSNNINDKNSINWMKKLKPDLILCLGWSSLFNKSVLKIPPYGTIGFHPTKLPLNRGRHPIIWTLALGLKETACTFFYMNQKADAGKIIVQKKIKILKDDNATSLYKKIILKSQKLIDNFMPKLKKKTNLYVSYKNPKPSNYWRKRFFLDGEIDWRMSAKNIHNLVKSLTDPYPYAHFLFNKKVIKVIKTKIINQKLKNIEPGKIIENKNKMIIIKCGEHAIQLVKTFPKVRLKNNLYL